MSAYALKVHKLEANERKKDSNPFQEILILILILILFLFFLPIFSCAHTHSIQLLFSHCYRLFFSSYTKASLIQHLKPLLNRPHILFFFSFSNL